MSALMSTIILLFVRCSLRPRAPGKACKRRNNILIQANDNAVRKFRSRFLVSA